jgi:hypothetical protein
MFFYLIAIEIAVGRTNPGLGKITKLSVALLLSGDMGLLQLLLS